MTKKELMIEVKKVVTEALGLETPVTTAVTEEIYGKIVDIHIKELLEKEETAIPNIGKLLLKVRSERIVKNPKTGEDILVPVKKVVRFKATKSLKEKTQ